MITLLMPAILVIYILATIVPALSTWLRRVWQQSIKEPRLQRHAAVFDTHFIEPKAFYVSEFRRIPSIVFISDVDAAKAFNYIQAGKCGRVVSVYQRNWYNWRKQRMECSKTLFKLSNRSLIKLGEDYAEIFFDKDNFHFAQQVTEALKECKAPAREEANEINIITLTSNGLDLKQLAIRPTELDLDLYYNDDFLAVDKIIRDRLSKENDKGIILLHGLPETGKTTYLRHLIGSIQKKILFVSPGVAGNLMNPEFIDLLIDNTNAILVIEDAENIIMDRRYNSGSSVSNLLNISDGLLSDCLNVQIICTFNSALHLIDSALLRKGRLIAKYEFGKLSVSKAVKLSEHLGLSQSVDKPMTLAEITNPGETNYTPAAVQVIGFRREVLEN